MKFAKNHSLACCECLGEVKWPLSHDWYSIFKCKIDCRYVGIRSVDEPWWFNKETLIHQKDRELASYDTITQIFYETILDMILGSESH